MEKQVQEDPPMAQAPRNKHTPTSLNPTLNPNPANPTTCTTPSPTPPPSSTSASPSALHSKPCTLCHAPRNVLIRCQIDETKKWHFVCTGRCWEDVSGGEVDGDGKHAGYRYGGMWKNKHEAVSAKIKGKARDRNRNRNRKKGVGGELGGEEVEGGGSRGNE